MSGHGAVWIEQTSSGSIRHLAHIVILQYKEHVQILKMTTDQRSLLHYVKQILKFLHANHSFPLFSSIISFTFPNFDNIDPIIYIWLHPAYIFLHMSIINLLNCFYHDPPGNSTEACCFCVSTLAQIWMSKP